MIIQIMGDAEGSLMMAGNGAGPDVTRSFACLHRTERGRIFHCAAYRRVVIEFGGAHLILRPWEFRRLREHLGRIAACRFTRARLLGGERVRLRDATGEGALILDLGGLQDLVELMEAGASGLDSGGFRDVAGPLGAARGESLFNGPTMGYHV
jgi:hypothetical protein